MRILMLGAMLAGAISCVAPMAAAAVPPDRAATIPPGDAVPAPTAAPRLDRPATIPIGEPVATPLVLPDQGRIGVSLSHDETAALADGPIPALVSKVLPMNRMGAGLRPDSRIYHDEHGGVHASLRELLLESAEHPDGNVIVYLDAPGTHGSRVLDVYEHWH